ncbi:MAG: glycosyltransferase family 39 protein [Candidatus Hydrogenedentota bacterium]
MNPEKEHLYPKEGEQTAQGALTCAGGTVFDIAKLATGAVCFACTLFTALAALGVLGASFVGIIPADRRFMAVLAAKVLCFGGAAAVSAWALRRCRMSFVQTRPENAVEERRPLNLAALLIPLAVASFLVFPRLDAYPWPAPDETFHLTMARNLAVYGQYASGRPETGFVPFDGYASVGPAVLVPIALAFKVFGVSLVAARVVMALFFLALCVVVFFLLRPRFGDTAAGAGVVLLTGAFGSVYLARSLYGEVPALFYAVAALLLWKRSLEKPETYFAGLLAGIAFALALMSKLFFAIAIFPLLTVLILDRFHFKTLRWQSLFFPSATFLGVWGGWVVLETVYGAGDTISTTNSVAMHMHYLLFGFDSLSATAKWLLEQPVTLVFFILGFSYVFAKGLRRPVAPVLLTFVLLVPFFMYWWLFFTTGRHPRYMFYACAIAGATAGPLLVAAGQYAIRRKSAPRVIRLAAAVLVAVGVGPPFIRTWEQVRLVYTSTEARDDIAVARFVDGLPENARIVTTYWPLSRTLDFLTDRPIEMMRELPQDMRQFDAIIIDQHTQEQILEGRPWNRSVGRYGILTPGEQ